MDNQDIIKETEELLSSTKNNDIHKILECFQKYPKVVAQRLAEIVVAYQKRDEWFIKSKWLGTWSDMQMDYQNYLEEYD